MRVFYAYFVPLFVCLMNGRSRTLSRSRRIYKTVAYQLMNLLALFLPFLLPLLVPASVPAFRPPLSLLPALLPANPRSSLLTMKSFTQSLTLLVSVSALFGSSLALRPHVRAAQHKRLLDQHKRDLQGSLFPASHTYSSGFTTASDVSVSGVSSVELSDNALNVIKVQSGMSHNVVTQSGKTAWEANYPEGSWNPSNTPLGGFGFYLGGTDEFSSAVSNGAKEVMFAYSIMFEDGFDFNKGGKLPGACKCFCLSHVASRHLSS